MSMELTALLDIDELVRLKRHEISLRKFYAWQRSGADTALRASAARGPKLRGEMCRGGVCRKVRDADLAPGE